MAESLTALIFISHTSADDAFVAQLRSKLEGSQLPVWVDSRNLRGGSKLAPEIALAIGAARQVIVVLSPQTVNSPWVRREVKLALEVEKRCAGDGYRVIPLLLPGLTTGALGNWFDEEPVAVPIQLGPGGLDEAFPAILAALGERLPTDSQPAAQPDAKPLEELVLTLEDPKIETEAGKRRVAATAQLVYEPASPTARRVESKRFHFTAPLGPIEADDLRWYLEQYFVWPVGVFQARAEGIEEKLPQWGEDLFKAALGAETAREALTAWQHAVNGAERRFSVAIDRDALEGASDEVQAATNEAATELLALPWELLRDRHGWLFQGRHPALVRRRLPNREDFGQRLTALPIRILLVSPRPEKDSQGEPVGYIDHRVSARPLVEAVESLGELVRLTLLTPPTYGALDNALQAAAERGEPFDVVHFDGHGVFNRKLGLGGLCFEDPKDAVRIDGRTMEFVDAKKLASLFHEHRVPLVFLEACQSAKSETDPTASVAACLLEVGVTSVVAMSHSVLVETARRFVEAFYKSLAAGARVGRAMLDGQSALHSDTWRGKIMGAGDLRLQDWFVPVIYQEKHDPHLVTKIPAQQVQQLAAQRRKLSLGDLPEPEHKFQGRSRELLALERLLVREPWAVVRGTGGAGKTTLAAELARWLTRTHRFERAAFVSLEHHRDARAVLDTIGHQLLPEGKNYSVAQFADLDQALQPIERALRDHATIIVLDNCESALPLGKGRESDLPLPAEEGQGESETLTAILALCKRLLDADARTRLVFTSREWLPAPFRSAGRQMELGALAREDAIELVSQVMKDNGWTPPPADAGNDPEQVVALVEAVQCHARALVLLAREVAQSGVRSATADLRALMAELERKHPNDRENSLYASVELSLRRLSPAAREHIQSLAVCQGGVYLSILAMLTGLEMDDARQLAIELIEVGLGEHMDYGHMRLDPGLPPYLLGQLTDGEMADLRARWAEAMAGLTDFLSQQHFQDARFTAQLMLLELPNLLAMLDWLRDRWPPEQVVGLARKVESLVAELGRPAALARATRVREAVAKKLGDWSPAAFLSAASNIERLVERRDLTAAHAAAQQLLQRCLTAGDTAYPGADYDTAYAQWQLGLVLQRGGGAEAALEPLAGAQRLFQQLSDAGSASANRMVSVVIVEMGNCLTAVGQLDKAAAAYENGIQRAEKLNDRRQVAVNKLQLGTLRMYQQRYSEALKTFVEGLDTFASLGEPRQVAEAWHQIGIVHEETGQFEPAEQAYRQSLSISVRENDLIRQAATLNHLGILYDELGRLEEAVIFYRQSAEISVRLQELFHEGGARTNLASTLIMLRRYDEARQELQRAIECREPYGHAAELWKTWAILEDLERATGDETAALAAWQQALETYLAYRRAGGESQSNLIQMFVLVAQAIGQHQTDEAGQQLAQIAVHPRMPDTVLVLIAKLQAILAGDRNPALAADPDLNPLDAVELQLLLEGLSAH